MPRTDPTEDAATPRRDGFFGEAGLPAWARVGNAPFVLAIFAYQITLSPLMGRHCRFEPTCSRYAMGAYRRFGPFRGSAMTLRRLGACHPFHAGGYDPVPVRGSDPLHSPPARTPGTTPAHKPPGFTPRASRR